MPKSTRGTQWKIIALILTGVVILLSLLLIRSYKREPIEPVVKEPPPILRPIPEGDIVLIIDDFGYRNDEVTDGFLTLDAPMTYAVIPGHRFSESFGKAASEKGYEVIIHMPMETHARVNGETEFRLLTDMEDKEIQRRLEKAFHQLPMAVGMNNHQGSKGTENRRLMEIVAQYLRSRGAYFIDSRTSAQSIGEEVMRTHKVPTSHRAVFLDNDADPDLIRIQLSKLKEKSRIYGFAIGIGHARPNTLNVLREELPRIQEEGFRLLYASQGIG